jgi:hypothetical protein
MESFDLSGKKVCRHYYTETYFFQNIILKFVDLVLAVQLLASPMCLNQKNTFKGLLRGLKNYVGIEIK